MTPQTPNTHAAEAEKTGDWDTAIAGYTLEINKPTDEAKTSKTYLKRAKVRCFQSSKRHIDGDFSDVVEDASLTLALSPGDENAKILRAVGYYLSGDYESAKRDYRKIVEYAKAEKDLDHSAELIAVYELLGSIYAKRSKRKDLDLAVKFYNAALSCYADGADMPSISLTEKYHEVCRKLRTAED